MWKHVLECVAGPGPTRVSVRVDLRRLPWRRIAADAGLFAALLLASSWLLVR